MYRSDYETKSAALDKQIAKVSDAQSYASARTQIHYLAINERNNVREKHVANNIKSMTNGQLNSYYNRSYREGNKARDKAEQEAYDKEIEENDDNIFIINIYYTSWM